MGPLLDLPSVGLDTLNATAELLVRTDRKYVIPIGDLPALVAGVSGLRVLEIDGRRASAYESTYLDTTDLASWSASAHQRRRRWKVRTRLYADTGECWLEVKTRGTRGVTVKERLTYDPAHRDQVHPEAAAWVADRLTVASPQVDPQALVATLDTSYHRSTLLLPGGAGRATVDSGLTWAAGGTRALVGPVLVLETKAPPGAAGALDRRLWALGHRPVRISKYGTGLSLLTPELPGNRWHRVATRYLSPNLVVTRQDAA